jgi:hypothetical protein
MSLIEETYRKIDPEGEVNLAFDDVEVMESLNRINMERQQRQQQMELANGISFNKKKGKNFLDA